MGEVIRSRLSMVYDAAALADIMKTLIQHPEQIAAMAANIRPVRTLSEHVDDLERIYQRVLQQCD